MFWQLLGIVEVENETWVICHCCLDVKRTVLLRIVIESEDVFFPRPRGRLLGRGLLNDIT
jgi:hypothetical protein